MIARDYFNENVVRPKVACFVKIEDIKRIINSPRLD